MLQIVRRGGLDLLAAPELERDSGIRVTFTGRHGGSSLAPFESLNLSYSVGDGRGAVASNRRKVGEAVGVMPEGWVVGRQVHGAGVMEVGRLEKGRGGLDYESALTRTDGLLTGIPGMALAVLTADCVPVVLVAPAGRTAGVAHCGWRGVLAGVLRRAFEKLVVVSGCAPGEVLAFLGPHIGPCCMEVEGEVSTLFKNMFASGVVSGAHLDIGAACTEQMVSEGMEPKNIFASGVCTACSGDYFSFRGDSGNTGRQAGIVAVFHGEPV